MSVCLPAVFLSAHILQKPHSKAFIDVCAHLASGGVAICYVLPVLWMTSHWLSGALYIHKQRE